MPLRTRAGGLGEEVQRVAPAGPRGSLSGHCSEIISRESRLEFVLVVTLVEGRELDIIGVECKGEITRAGLPQLRRASFDHSPRAFPISISPTVGFPTWRNNEAFSRQVHSQRLEPAYEVLKPLYWAVGREALRLVLSWQVYFLVLNRPARS
jgi:hypothetical protein